MVYFAELLVVMTDGLKIVRIRARNVPRRRTHKRLDDDAFLASLAPGKRQCRVLMRRGYVLMKHKQELSYRKQIARQLRTQYVEGIYDNSVTLKSRLTVTQLKTEPLSRSYTTYY